MSKGQVQADTNGCGTYNMKCSIKHYIKRYIKSIMILAIGFGLAGCGQTGGLFLVESEAEYNEGHFMLPYRGDDKTSASTESENQLNTTSDLPNNNTAQ